MDESDEVLMARYASGDAAAFQELFRRYERRIYGFLLRRSSSPERAADLFQDLFLRLHRFRSTFRPDRSFSRWLFQIARNVLADDVRRELRIPRLAPSDFEPSAPADAEARTGAREELEIVLGDLSDEQIGILVATKAEGACYPELAEGLGRSPASIKQIASRALRRLRAAHATPAAARR